MRKFLTWGLGLLLAAVALPAHAQPGMGPWLDEALPAVEGEPLQMLKACPDQSLSGGVQLKERPELYRVMAPDAAWGRPEMIELITRAAEEMAWLKPDADPIVIGDISRRWGGPLAGHKSHRGGIDVDVGLYWGNGEMLKTGFKSGSPQELDLEANWLLIRSMLDTGLVERILLDQRNIDAIKAWTIKNGELTKEEAEAIFPAPSTRRWNMTGVVHHTANHREHLHVRIFCART
ncbi:MAG: hypothetical protein RL071_4405 [Pseudomonadota bacterium]|jgi:murein endopeptidase